MAFPASCIFNKPALFRPELLTLRVNHTRQQEGVSVPPGSEPGAVAPTHTWKAAWNLGAHLPLPRAAEQIASECASETQSGDARRSGFPSAFRGRRETASALSARSHLVPPLVPAVTHAVGCFPSPPVTELESINQSLSVHDENPKLLQKKNPNQIIIKTKKRDSTQ